ncbi:L-ascorbate oxidase homolog isoform X2 [Andrographis paniculata]|uniref:L-ascorbate oxidase homolog isoform X2 n=1 Tax=Andrographis paniculata TaxID=175694 RepID=UPI0021E9869B|nr:L-ascorbate oxidase homolog isoform X2 [Andrographis paniculata]
MWRRCALAAVVWAAIVGAASGEDPYRFFTWNVTYGVIQPLGVPQKGILINGQFPGPDIHSVTNNNLVINVFNTLSEPFLISWNGIQHRRNSYQDGVYGTTCPIPPGKNFTYKLQVKDQIGSFFYFPSTAFHKAAGGFGGIRILSRPRIPVPFPAAAGDLTVLIGEWYNTDHTVLKSRVDNGELLPFPDGILINGHGTKTNPFKINVDPGKTYRLRISNVGLHHSLNFRIQGHTMKLVEVEGTHTIQTVMDSLDVHVGQSYSVLVAADQTPRSYHIAVSTRFTDKPLTATAILHYNHSREPVSGPTPPPPTADIRWSMNQALSIRTNLTASGPRPNPQGSFRYGQINVTRTIRLASSSGLVNGRPRFGVNGVSFVPADTPLKLVDYFNISGVFRVGSIADSPPESRGVRLGTSVMGADYEIFAEIVLENNEMMDDGPWSPEQRKEYNLVDAVSRCTTQVYPKSWTAILVALDNVGMWNMRTELWAQQYLGQQFYIRVYTPVVSPRDELPLPDNALLCGRAAGKKF